MPFIIATTTIDKIQNTSISNTPPIAPTIGQLWNDTSVTPPVLKMWNGTEWEIVHTNIKQLDPVAFEDINKIIDNTIEEVNQSRNDINNALSQSQEALKQAGLANENISNMQDDLNEAVKNSSDALNQSELAHQEALNNTKTIQAFKDETSQKFVEIKADSNALATQVSDLDKREQSSTVQLSNQISTIITNGINLFPNGKFNDSQLDAYFRGHLSVSKVVNGQLQITSKNVNTYIRTKDSLMVNEGDVLVCDFDYIKNFDGGNLAFGIVDDGANKWKWITDSGSNSANSDLRHSKVELTVPSGFSKVDLYVGIFNVNDSLVGKTFFLDNVYVKQKYVNQTEFNQTIDGLQGRIESTDKKVTEVSAKADGIITKIDDPSTGIEAIYKNAQTAMGEITEIKDLTGSSTIVETVKGISTTVQDKADKSEVTQLAGQITETVENQEAINKRVTTAEKNIVSLTTSDGKQNQRLDTAEKSLQVISKKTDDNTEVINQTKATADSNSQKIVSTDGRVSTVEQTLTKQSQTIADNSGRINQAVQDIDSANRTISNIDGRVSQVEQKADGITSTVSNVQNQLNNKANQSDLDKTNQVLSGKAEQSEVKEQLKNRSNLWPDSTFENKNLSTYTTIPDGNNLVHIVTNGVKSTANDSPREYGVEYRKQNSSNKALRFEGRTDGNRDCFLKDDYMFDVSDGDVFNVSYDFYKKASSTATVGFKCIKYDGSTVDWLGVFGNNNSGSHWWHKDGQITIPSGKGIVKVLPYAALNKTTNTSDYLYIDNIVITPQDTKQNSIDTQVKSQQTQINQKANKVDIIATANENPKAYFTLGTLDDGRGYITAGADYGFFLSTNVFISEGFKLSANHIDAGLIKGKQPSWMTEPSVSKPDDFKNSDLYSPQLDLDGKNVGEMSLTLFSNFPPTLTSKYYWTMKSQVSPHGISFNALSWTDSNILQVGDTASIQGFFNEEDYSKTGVIVQSGGNHGLKVVNTDAYVQLQKGDGYVVIGADGGDNTKSAIASNTIYAKRVQSFKDSENVGITFDDRIYASEGIWSDWTNSNNNRSHINFPNRNGGDVIELHTAEGDKNGVYTGIFHGNWTTNGISSQHHSIVPAGAGYTITFSNQETDNGQGTADAAVIAAKFITNSSKELKTDVKPIENIDKAVDDILKIEPKQYLYKTQKEKIQEWENNGHPEGEYQNLDTEINIGLLAEDLDNYDSLRPFLEKVTDEYGNSGILGIDYSKLTPLLLAVCQKQQNEIDQLSNRITQLELSTNNFNNKY